jgi:hypothetical protein
MATSKVRYTYLEKWDTRFGESDRIVIRDKNGKFVDNLSLSALRDPEKSRKVVSR